MLGESLADVSEMMEKRGEKDDRRDAAGYRKEVSDDDRATMVRQKDAFVQQAITGYLESEVTSARKRRAAGSYTKSPNKPPWQHLQLYIMSCDRVSMETKVFVDFDVIP